MNTDKTRFGLKCALTAAATAVAVSLLAGTTLAATLPSGFIEESIGGSWNEAAGMTFDDNGRMYVWERGGRIWIVNNGVKSAQPMLDISDEVGGWRDYGLLGVALDPNFLQNGYVYLLYVVDHHHLANFGTLAYNPGVDEYFQATIGRVTRYTARAADGFTTVDPASRRILMGETIDTGMPIVHQSHGVGALVFGTDGTLLISCGDGASYSSTDIGSASETYYAQALNEGIIKQKENIGALRSQLVDSHNGKVLRIDPATGDGLSSNPYFDPSAPRAARSRVWALGLRNPCRMTLRPETGSHNPADGDPGVLYIGDVGWNTWEDLHVCTGPGQNFGWPIYEGMDVRSDYRGANVLNLDAPIPPSAGCGRTHYYFRELIQQDTLNPAPFTSECNPSVLVPASIPTFVHNRPAIDWRHGSGPSRTAYYNGSGNSVVVNVGAAGSPVSGPQFGGNCSIGGVWYMGSDFPVNYRNTYFQADYGAQWIRSFSFDANDRPTLVQDFLTGGGGVVAMATHPQDGQLYYISWSSTLRRIRYVPSGNQPPVAVVDSNVTYGPGPLTVQFIGSGSTDPESQALSYSWNFGDGSPASTSANPSHTFNAPAGVPSAFTVTLTVTDAGGLTATAQRLISVNNTPPQVLITSPANGTLYPMDADTEYPLIASVTDAEFSDAELLYQWQTILHHNNHTHAEPIDENHVSTTIISPVGCNQEVYFYRVTLTVTDPAGLSATSEVYLYPDCPNRPPVASFQAAPTQGQAPLLVLLDASASSDPDGDALTYGWDFGDGTYGQGLNASHTYTALGNYTVTLTTTDPDGLTDTDSGLVAVVPPGLEGTYFDNIDLTNPRLTRFDTVISFDWGSGSPDPSIGPDTFSVRWEGAIEPLYSELYTLYAMTDDGFRLWIDDQLVIDSWIDQAPTERSGLVNLTAGQRHAIRIEYYENGGGAVARLLWSSASQAKEVVPAGRLFPPGADNTPPSISDIADQDTDEDTATALIEFTVGDAETTPASLVVSGTSDNPLLVHDHEIAISGAGENRQVQITPEPDAFGTATITLVVSDGEDTAEASFLLTVNSVNDAPSLALPTGALAYQAGSGPQPVDPAALVSDIDSANLAGGFLHVALVANGQAEDRLNVRHVGNGPGQVGRSGGSVLFAGTVIGTVSGGTDGATPLVVSLNGSATPTMAQAVLRNVTYENVAAPPSTPARSLQAQVADGDGGTSPLAGLSINITAPAVDPVVTWAQPAPISYGTALGAQQLNATANVPGSFAYAPSAGTVLQAGLGQVLEVTFTPSDTSSYNTVTRSVLLDVLPAALTITAQDKSKVYGAAVPPLTAAYVGFANGDDSSDLDTAPSLSTTADITTGVGTRPILASGAFDPNYTFIYVEGTMTITAASLVITADDKTRNEGEPNPVFTATFDGLVNGDSPASLDSPAQFSTDADAASPGGTYVIEVFGAADLNYRITHLPGTLTVIGLPGAPSGLNATTTSSDVTLSWNPATAASSYLVRRGTSSGGPYVVLASGLSGTSFEDGAVAAGVTYYYVVAGENAAGIGPDSNEASALIPAFAGVRINFQPSGVEIPAGYQPDVGFVFGSRGNGFSYGWDVGNTAFAYDRDDRKTTDQRYDTLQRMDGNGTDSIWEIAVPAGTYDILIVAGDPKGNRKSYYKIDVEGLLTLDGEPGRDSQFVSGSRRISVSDGRMTVTAAVGAKANRICFIDILPAPDGGGAGMLATDDDQPRIQLLQRRDDGAILLSVNPPLPGRYAIEASSDLGWWERIGTAVSSDGLLRVAEPAIHASPRFYRVILLPE